MGKFIINSNVSEKDMVEYCFNMWNSGFDYKIVLFFHAMAHSWKYKKLIYYVSLIEGDSTWR